MALLGRDRGVSEGDDVLLTTEVVGEESQGKCRAASLWFRLYYFPTPIFSFGLLKHPSSFSSVFLEFHYQPGISRVSSPSFSFLHIFQLTIEMAITEHDATTGGFWLAIVVFIIAIPGTILSTIQGIRWLQAQ